MCLEDSIFLSSRIENYFSVDNAFTRSIDKYIKSQDLDKGRTGLSGTSTEITELVKTIESSL